MEVLDDGRSVSVVVPDAGQAVLEVVRLLDSSGLNPESIMVREPTLDEVFLQLYGPQGRIDRDESRGPALQRTDGRGGVERCRMTNHFRTHPSDPPAPASWRLEPPPRRPAPSSATP